MVTNWDAAMERRVMGGEIRELRELKDALELIEGVLKISDNRGYAMHFVAKNEVSILETAAKLLFDAKAQNDKIRIFSQKLERDFRSLRKESSREKYLTAEERLVLSITNNVAEFLTIIIKDVKNAIYFANQAPKHFDLSQEASTAGKFLSDAQLKLKAVILAVRHLYILERQIDIYLER